MEKVTLEENEYEIVKDYKNGYNKDELVNKYTDYFKNFDYIVGDWAYGKLRLKGFYEKSNKNCKDINNIDNLDKYIKENCAFDCAYFVAKRK
ncbi:MAG: YutD-like domain-containing protein [Candidatus Aphodocola sp.]